MKRQGRRPLERTVRRAVDAVAGVVAAGEVVVEEQQLARAAEEVKEDLADAAEELRGQLHAWC
jgi:hypothetical protein